MDDFHGAGLRALLHGCSTNRTRLPIRSSVKVTIQDASLIDVDLAIVCRLEKSVP
jgi:hypothetical protein